MKHPLLTNSQRLALFALFLCCSRPSAAGDSPIQSYLKQLKGKNFSLRAHEELLPAHFAAWNSRRIYEADVAASNKSWQGKWFVSTRRYVVKDVTMKSDTNSAQIKLLSTSKNSQLADEIRLNLPNLNTLTVEVFKERWFTMFFEPSEDIGKYVNENDKQLISYYIDTVPELLTLPNDDRKKILDATRSIGSSGRPQLEKTGSNLYLPAELVTDGSVYNDIRVPKNERIASSIEGLLPGMKASLVRLEGLPNIIHGIRFYWTIRHRNFLHDKENDYISDHMELLVSADALKKLAAGNLSVFEMLQESILRADGTKITLISYEPIGSR